MATTTLPAAANQDPFQLITVKNLYQENLIVSPQVGESLEEVVDQTSTVRPLCSKTYQSNGVDGWYAVTSGKPNAEVYIRNASALPVAVPLAPTWATLTGTEFTVTIEGVFLYTGTIAFDVAAVPGNQAWNVDLQWYDSTNSVVLGTFTFSGAGDPTAPVRGGWAGPIIGVQTGADTFLRVSRTLDTGAIDVDVCDTEITGPI